MSLWEVFIRILRRQNILPWLVCGLAATYVLYQFLLQASTSVMIPYLEQAFNINALDVSLLSSSFFYTYLLLQIPAGILVDWLGPRQVLCWGILICAISSFMFALSENMLSAELSRMLMGIVTAPAVVCALKLAAQWFPKERFAILVGLTEMLGMLGGAIGEAFLARCVDGSLGWRGTLWLCGFVGIALALMVWIFVFDNPKQLVNVHKIKDKKSNFSFKASLIILANRRIWIIGLSAGLMFAVLTAFASFWCVPFLMHDFDFSLRIAAVASATLFIGAAIGNPFLGWLSDRWGKRRILMQIGSVLAATVILLLLLVHFSMVVVFMLLFFIGFFAAGYVIAFAMVSDTIDITLKATALGFVNMLSIFLGAPILQPIIGKILQISHNNFSLALMLLPISFLLSFSLLFFVHDEADKVF